MSTTTSSKRLTLRSIAERLAELEQDHRSRTTPVLDNLLTPAMLADGLGMTERTLSEWRITGAGPVFIRVGKTIRYRPGAVDDWLLTQEHRSTSEERR